MLLSVGLTSATPKLAEMRKSPRPALTGVSLNTRRSTSATASAAGLSRSRQQDGELLAADAREEVDLAQTPAAHLPQMAERLVAAGVPVGVVDPLEVVEVQHHQRRLGAEAPHALDLQVCRGDEIAAIG